MWEGVEKAELNKLLDMQADMYEPALQMTEAIKYLENQEKLGVRTEKMGAGIW